MVSQQTKWTKPLESCVGLYLKTQYQRWAWLSNDDDLVHQASIKSLLSRPVYVSLLTHAAGTSGAAATQDWATTSTVWSQSLPLSLVSWYPGAGTLGVVLRHWAQVAPEQVELKILVNTYS